MSDLLLFFALPIAVIIISIALQKILKNSFLVAAIIFAFFLVITFVVGDIETLLIATIVYTIIAFITAVLVKFIKRILKILNRQEEENNDDEDNDDNDNCGRLNEMLDVDSTLYQNPNGRVGNYYRCNRR